MAQRLYTILKKIASAIYSPDGTYSLSAQDDGNLVWYNDGTALSAFSGAGTCLMLRSITVLNNATNQKLYIRASNETSYGAFIGVLNSIWTMSPITNNYMSLGTTSYRWRTLYSTNSVNVSSDKRLKDNITELPDSWSEAILKLTPVSYTLKDDEEGGTHLGLIAQDVEEVLKDAGIDSSQLSFIGRPAEDGDGESYYSLAYGELIAPMIATLKSQQEKIAVLEEKIVDLEERLSKIEAQ